MVDFKDGKDESALRTIGEVSEALGIKPHVLRYWEQQFALLKPMKRSGGRRYYRSSDVEMVEAIDRLINEEGYTLKGAEAVLRSGGGPKESGADRRRGEDRRMGDRRADGDEVGEPISMSVSPQQVLTPAVEETIAQLKVLRNRLAKAIEA
ncbi:transcriptional regulator [Erythrobacter sp. KY5]|uniref:MerR family transcriptional regulator n=1 Tax=Erythrobacter sp. KY5 TaxID=2011159 RepID=UPI000DBEF80B|nr:MerR family transcriptional regulator [Erythrobacter sp. KY5]AWW75241.1 transcriptional regulator [Erythrobacter sp. KY5]